MEIKLKNSKEDIIESYVYGHVHDITDSLIDAWFSEDDSNEVRFNLANSIEEGIQLGIEEDIECDTEEDDNEYDEDKYDEFRHNIIEELSSKVLDQVLDKLENEGYDWNIDFNGYYVIYPSDKLIEEFEKKEKELFVEE